MIAVFGKFSDIDYQFASQSYGHFGWNNAPLGSSSDCRVATELEFPHLNPGNLLGVCAEYDILCRSYQMMRHASKIKFFLYDFVPPNNVVISTPKDKIKSATAAEFYLAVKLFPDKIIMPLNFFDQIQDTYMYDDFVQHYESQAFSPNPLDYSFPYYAHHLAQSLLHLNGWLNYYCI